MIPTVSTDFKKYSELPEEERDRLGFRQWQWRSRVGTHGPDCYQWGPAHYECALRKIEELQAMQSVQSITLDMTPDEIKALIQKVKSAGPIEYVLSGKTK